MLVAASLMTHRPIELPFRRAIRQAIASDVALSALAAPGKLCSEGAA
jgi:hypothetical protein